ncbi:TauD/TfdA family dioxygenase [Actinomadura napierensis]|uniref:TauD/TfdA family dioxygenase n=1 Tax=Actinomadura napierensis TaxID=267854 RepID=UPI0031E34EAF
MTGVDRLTLRDSEIEEIDLLLTEVTARHGAVDDAAFLREAEVIAHRLPLRLRTFLASCRSRERPLFVVEGWPVRDDALGPTPPDWQEAWRGASGRSDATYRHQLLLVLAASLIGDAFALSTVQDGHLVNHIVPVRGTEEHVSATSSTRELAWHTEEAGFRLRPDHLAFVCLRNPDKVPTTVGLVDDLVLDPAVEEMLRRPLFGMPRLGTEGRIEYAPVLYGPADRPYLSADSVYMSPAPGADTAAEALAVLGAALDAVLRPFTARPGDLYFLDNHRAVHGRPAFRPRYDGTDRWLLRVKAGRDLRGSAACRAGAGARVVDVDRLA